MEKSVFNVIAAYEKADIYRKNLKKYLDGKTKETPDAEFTNELIDEVEKLAKIINVKRNRIKVIFISLIAEETILYLYKANLSLSDISKPLT